MNSITKWYWILWDVSPHVLRWPYGFSFSFYWANLPFLLIFYFHLKGFHNGWIGNRALEANGEEEEEEHPQGNIWEKPAEETLRIVERHRDSETQPLFGGQPKHQ